MGGRFSAEVGREATVFKATVARGDVKAALDVLAKAARGAAVNSANVQAAKGAVLCELEGKPLSHYCFACSTAVRDWYCWHSSTIKSIHSLVHIL
jgi:Insulinase (Peptidase family M16)